MGCADCEGGRPNAVEIWKGEEIVDAVEDINRVVCQSLIAESQITWFLSNLAPILVPIQPPEPGK